MMNATGVQVVKTFVAANPDLTTKEIRAGTGLAAGSVDKSLYTMRKKGVLVSDISSGLNRWRVKTGSLTDQELAEPMTPRPSPSGLRERLKRVSRWLPREGSYKLKTLHMAILHPDQRVGWYADRLGLSVGQTSGATSGLVREGTLVKHPVDLNLKRNYRMRPADHIAKYAAAVRAQARRAEKIAEKAKQLTAPFPRTDVRPGDEPVVKAKLVCIQCRWVGQHLLDGVCIDRIACKLRVSYAKKKDPESTSRFDAALEELREEQHTTEKRLDQIMAVIAILEELK